MGNKKSASTSGSVQRGEGEERGRRERPTEAPASSRTEGFEGKVGTETRFLWRYNLLQHSRVSVSELSNQSAKL
jgi:hypothetical protein